MGTNRIRMTAYHPEAAWLNSSIASWKPLWKREKMNRTEVNGCLWFCLSFVRRWKQTQDVRWRKWFTAQLWSCPTNLLNHSPQTDPMIQAGMSIDDGELRRPTPTRWTAMVNVPADLQRCTHVLVWHDAVCRLLQQACDGPIPSHPATSQKFCDLSERKNWHMVTTS